MIDQRSGAARRGMGHLDYTDGMTRLVMVSNRIALPKRGAAPGGLAVGLMAAVQAHGGLWFGWGGDIVDGTPAAPDSLRRGEISFVTTQLTQADYQDYYLGFCNQVLWPLFHYFVDNFRYLDAQYDAYQRVNHRLAGELRAFLEPDDLVWVHDYHLLPLGQKLRDAGCRQPIGFFLHIPFPRLDVLRVLPVYGDLLQSLLAYDVIGFQTTADLAAFRNAVAYMWGDESLVTPESVRVGHRLCTTAVFPIGVDIESIQNEAITASVTEPCKRMVTGLLGRRLMLGVDRLDYSKGLVHRFNAYERFLEAHPENQNRVTFLQVAPLSRVELRAYSDIRGELEQTTGRINGRFADTDWTPIRYLNRNFAHDVLMSFLRNAQVGIVTPLRDGMNLVAKEFVAAQDANDPGVLILSGLAGAAQELTTALIVNPYDIRGMAHAIQQAFNMPLAERRDRHQAMLETLARNSIHAWHREFVDCLTASRRVSQRPVCDGTIGGNT